jgi:hypothetical protein
VRGSKAREATTVGGRFPYSPAKSRSGDFEVGREANGLGLVLKICTTRVLRKRVKRRTIGFYLDVVVGDVTSGRDVGGFVTGIGPVVGRVGAGREVGWYRSSVLHVADNEMRADRGGISRFSKASLRVLSVAPARSGESACRPSSGNKRFSRSEAEVTRLASIVWR